MPDSTYYIEYRRPIVCTPLLTVLKSRASILGWGQMMGE